MSEKKARLKIEDGIAELLSGDAQENALDFVAYLRANKISITQTYPDTWKASFKGKTVCDIVIKDGNWHLVPRGEFFSSDYESIFTDENIKKSAREY